MSKWTVSLPFYCSVWVSDIEADTEDEAVQKAFNEVSIPTVCHQCSNEIEIGEWCEDGWLAEKIEE